MRIEKLGHLLERRDVRGAPDLPLLGVSVAEGVRVRGVDDGRPAPSLDLTGYKRVRVGEIIMNALGKPHGSIGRSGQEGITSPAYWVLEASQEIEGRFAHHLLRSTWAVQRFAGMGKHLPPNQFDLPWETFREISIRLPDLEQQRRIADFLDDRVARIDQIIAARIGQMQAVAELGRERREAHILGRHGASRAAPPKWSPYQAVPIGWRECRLRSLSCAVQTGPFGSQLHSDDYEPDGWPVINPASISDTGIVPLPGMAIGEQTRQRLARHVLQEGDVIFGRRGDLGKAALVTPAEAGWLCGTGSLVVRLQDNRLRPEFLVRLLRTRAVRSYFDQQSVGSTMDNLNTEILLGVPLLLPPAPEQQALLDRIARSEGADRAQVGRLQRSIDLLAEYKQSLITAAVTGELDVTTAASGIPE